MKTKAFFCMVLVSLFLLPGCASSSGKEPFASGKPTDNAENGDDDSRFFNGCLAVAHDELVYFTEQTPAGKVQLTYFYDCKTGSVMPLCSKPECSHDSADCMAYYPSTFGEMSYSFFNGELYWIGDLSAKDGKKLVNVYACAPDGTGRRVAAQLDWEYDALANGFFGIYDGRIYRGGTGSYVNNGKAASGMLVYSQAVKGGSEPKEIFRADGVGGSMICALASGSLYFAVGGEEETPSMKLYEYDIASDELKTLYEGEVPSWAFRMSALEDRLVFYEGDDVFCFLFNTREMSILEIKGKPGWFEVGDRTIYADTSFTGYACYDLEGNMLYEGERDPSLFHEEKQTKQYLGCYKGAFYFIYSSEKYHYLVVYDSNTGTWTVPWEAKVAK